MMNPIKPTALGDTMSFYRIFLSLLLAFTLTACGSQKEDEISLLEDIEREKVQNVEFEQEVNRVVLPTNAFSDSLMHHDLRVAYNAAITAVALNKPNHFANYDRVMPLCSDLIKLTGVRNIYLISHNNNLQNFVRNFCKQHGYVFNGSRNASVALQELHYSPARDLVLLDSGLDVTDARGNKTEKYYSSFIEVNDDPGSSTERAAPAGTAWPPLVKSAVGDSSYPIQALFAREVYLWIKKDVRSSSIPVAILSVSEGTEEEIGIDTAKDIYGDKVTEYLTKPLTDQMLKNLCDTLFHESDTQAWKDAKLESENLVIKACRSISDLEGKTTIFDVKILHEALIEALREPKEGQTAARPPHVRVEVIKCAASVNVQDAFIHLMDVARNQENVIPLRKAAIDALAKLIGKNNRIVPKGNAYEDVVKLLSSFLAEETDDIWESASFAFGHLKMNQKTKSELAVTHRLNKERKE